MKVKYKIVVIITTLLAAAVSQSLINSSIGQAPSFKVLVFTKTTGFRHDSIPNAIEAINKLGIENNFAVDATEDANVFNDQTLAQYRAVVFLLTTGDVLNANQQAAFERYIRAGQGYVGVHSASDTEYDWPWYGGLVGAYFLDHPAIARATIKVADLFHPSSKPLPKRWQRTDEWYNFRTNPRGKVHVLATLDEKTYPGGGMGFDHPITWCQSYDNGRSWYTAGGHTKESYSEPLCLQHILGGIEYAAGVKEYDCGATIDSRFQKVVLDNTVSDPVALSVAPDGRVFFIERGGAIKIYRPRTSDTVIAGQLSVFTGHEDGLLGIALDPAFQTNGWIYLFYSPAGSIPQQHVSRFHVVGDTIDLASEKIILKIPTQRDECCHSAGSLAFGPDGSLYIATGDNTNPHASQGFTPIDERPGRSAWDSQKSASNRNDLRGKILRIIPRLDGTYVVPDGNLFSKDGAAGRPEVYIMGVRNPYRITIDPANGWLYWGDIGPDAVAANASRGPAGLDEWNQAREAGNYGWPYCIGDNKPYIDYNFASGASGQPFNCRAPVNDSPNNTGPQQLPPAKPAWAWYGYSASVEFPELNQGGRTAMVGPVYHYNPDLQSQRKLPAYYDNTLFIYEWSRQWIKEVKLDEDGNILKINSFLPTFQFKRPIDMKAGPDGAIYLIEWGSNFWGNNPDAQIVRISYVPGQSGVIATDAVQFSEAAYNIGEGAARAVITLSRTGDTSVAASVDYITIDNTAAVACNDTRSMPGVAFARCDYATSVDTIRFASGETQKSFTIPIIDDAHVEGGEAFSIKLSNAIGTTLGAQSTVSVNILDNDTTPTTNPITQNEFFVRQQYLDFLSREPDADGFNGWIGVFNRCPNVENDPTCDRTEVSASFFRSQEFQFKGYFVYLFYKVSLGRLPKYTEIILDMRRVTGETGEEVIAKRRGFTNAFVQRQEFKGKFDNLTNVAFVDALLGRYGINPITTPDPANPDGTAKVTLTRNELVARLEGQQLTRAQVFRAVVQSQDIDRAEYNGAFVAMQYYGYLRREPEQAGYEAWLRVINRGDSYRVMVDGFLNSEEYKQRFGPPR